MRKKVLIVYLVLLHAVLCLVVVKSDFISRVEKKLGIKTTPALPPNTDSPFYQSLVMIQQRIDGNVPPGSVIFIGDSIAECLCVDAVTAPAVNFGISGDTTVGVLSRLPKYRSLGTAAAVVLAIGVNDLIRERSDDVIMENYRRVLTAIPTKIPILVSAMLPVEESLLKPNRLHNTTNRRIVNLNNRLRTLSESDARCLFVDAGVKLRNNVGALNSDFHLGDGLHISSEGYKILIEEWRNGLNEVRHRTFR